MRAVSVSVLSRPELTSFGAPVIAWEEISTAEAVLGPSSQRKLLALADTGVKVCKDLVNAMSRALSQLGDSFRSQQH